MRSEDITAKLETDCIKRSGLGPADDDVTFLAFECV